MSVAEILEEARRMPYDELVNFHEEVKKLRKIAWENKMLSEIKEAKRALHAGELPGGTAEEVIAQLQKSLEE